MYLLSSSG